MREEDNHGYVCGHDGDHHAYAGDHEPGGRGNAHAHAARLPEDIPR